MKGTGNDFYSTLDSDLQVYAKKVLGNESGSVIVMSTKGGDKMLRFFTLFNSNLFTCGISKFEFKKIFKK